MRYYGLIMLFMFACKVVPQNTVAQEDYYEDLSSYTPNLDSIQFHEKRNKVRLYQHHILLEGHIEDELDSILIIRNSQNNKPRTVSAFTIQLYTGGSRNGAEKTKQKFDALYPNMTSQIKYQQPNFKVRVGTFTNRLEAYKNLSHIKKSFKSALVVPTKLLINKGNESD